VPLLPCPCENLLSTAPRLAIRCPPAQAPAPKAAQADDARGAKQPEEGGEGAAAAADKPLPLAESLRCLAAAWAKAGADTVGQQGAPLAALLERLLKLPGQQWTTRQAAVAAASKFVAVGSAAGAAELRAWCWQLADGLATVSEESKVSQLRQEALEALRAALGAAGCGSSGGAGAGAHAAAAARVVAHADALLAHEPSAAVKALAAVVRGMLVGAGGGEAMDTSA
jgi:hypothetical protein